MSDENLRQIGKKNPFTGRQGAVIAGVGPVAKLLRRFICFGYYHSIEHSITAGGQVLDFGCGGGTVWLGKRYQVTGLDSCADSVRACQQLYNTATVGDICHAPFPSKSFDGAVSKFVLEHLPEEAGTEALAEIGRILKPGGLLVCLCDLECDHPQLAWLRSHFPDVYYKLYVLDPGHVGLRRSEEWRKLVEAAGFEVVEWRQTSRFPVLDHHPVGQLSKASVLPTVAKWYGLVALQVSKVRILVGIWTVLTAIIEETIGRWLPSQWAYRLVFVARKQL